MAAKEIITNRSQSDGFGSQYQQIIWTCMYAELTQKTFVYTPLNQMEHNYDNEMDFIEKKEWLINIINHFAINNHPSGNRATPVSGKDYFDQHVEACSKTKALQTFKDLFRQNKNRDHYFDNRYLNIAIHVRRPNPHDNRIEGTDIPDCFFTGMINKLRQSYASMTLPPRFHIYSQGNIENFKLIYSANDIILHINESIEDSFIALALADIMVMSPSTFSYVAGMISDGIVYYFPNSQKPFPNWIVMDLQGL